MPDQAYKKDLEAYKKDCRIACQYGIKCYQKNPTHHEKYKHPPKKAQSERNIEKELGKGRKRKSSDSEDESSNMNERETKWKKEDESAERAHSLSPSPTSIEESHSKAEEESNSSLINDSYSKGDTARSERNDSDLVGTSKTLEKVTGEEKKIVDKTVKKIVVDSSWEKFDQTIHKLFLTKMPDDFYLFYDFCKSLSPKDPTNAFKLVDIQLVGPYDVLSSKITADNHDDTEKYLRHWRYYYDPPEFQTVLKGNNKDGLHYGYWRDDIDQPPIYVAKNNANKDCIIEPVAPNIFGAMNKHINMRMARANPFEKGPMLKLSKRLKDFAKEKGISLDSQNSDMRTRDRNVVAKTFHGAGIVVPYDKKTQLGYRILGATDSQLKKILKRIDEAESDEERRSVMTGLEEVVRMATIAADECDFGTCLELGHDLFSSGIVHVQGIGLRMLASAYNLLDRKKFIRIAEAHAKDRKKGCDLGVI
ncbi:histone PARylation factor 1 isoform X2 [Venturia canescens]|uniref:histone PARylation factor 1 isoform X2 n=1 Tax=Venturia canescens TaxID=32260 RepID=UPI001C9C86E9|nr:histone PARylation factor 1 isoform X2 [Venturia canescens]